MANRSNKKELKNLRQNLRNNMPPAEILLWDKLKAKQLGGYKFRRQHSIDQYVLDFFCPKAQLAIEVDGDSHYQEKKIEYDRERQQHIESLGIKILRFTNNEIYDRLDGVLGEILRKLEEGSGEGKTSSPARGED